MRERIKLRLTHALLALLLTSGLLLPLLHILEPSFFSLSVLIPVAFVILLFELASLNRITAFVSAGLVVLALFVWLFGAGGGLIASDIVLAVALRSSGVMTALPLVASSAVPLITILVTLVCCFACLRGASILPASLLCFGMILLIYLADAGAMVPFFLPALMALLLLLLTDRFPETPLLPLLPVTVLLIAGAFLLTAGGVPANALQDKAEEFRQAILDRLFFTEPRDVFSLSTEGFYPQGQDQLGGSPAPSDTPVMQVSASRKVYLRGVVLNEYNGRAWQNTTGGRRYLRQSLRFASERVALFDEDLPAESFRNALCEPVNVTVRMLSDSASTLFVPQRVRELIPGGDLVPYFARSSELFITRNLKAGDTYSVSAPIFQAGDPGLGTLIEVCSTLEDNRLDRITETYTTLPSHLEEPVYALAREAASVAASPYDKALALQSWLTRNCRYTLDVEPQPGNLDFVTHFLLDTREGYCTYFASAMTVLCRMIGLPARYVEGYLVEPDENGQAVVTGLSAHAWTEVYFNGFGWLTFDATPVSNISNNSGNPDKSDGNPTDPPSEPSPEPTPEPTPTPSPELPESGGTENDPTPTPSDDLQPEEGSSPTPSPTSPEESPVPSDDPEEDLPSPPPDNETPPTTLHSPFSSFPWWWLLLALFLLAFALRVLLTSPAFRARRVKSEKAVFDIWTQEVADLLFAENLKRERSESPMAFGRRIDRTGPFGVALGPVGECISLIRYSRAEAGETDIGLVRDTSILLKGELSRPARLRYLLRRVFVPLKHRESL